MEQRDGEREKEGEREVRKKKDEEIEHNYACQESRAIVTF